MTNVIEKMQLVWQVVTGLPLLALMYIIGAIRIVMRDAYVSVYHNVKFLNGEVATMVNLGKEFFVGRKALTLQSDEGLLALVHGTPDGSFEIEGEIEDDEAMSFNFEQFKTYTLLSCYNGTHRDFESYSTYFVRDYRTLSNHPIVILPFFGRIIIWADWTTSAYMWAAMMPMFVGNFILGFCQGFAAGLRTRTQRQQLKFEDIPEEIRQKLENK